MRHFTFLSERRAEAVRTVLAEPLARWARESCDDPAIRIGTVVPDPPETACSAMATCQKGCEQYLGLVGYRADSANTIRALLGYPASWRGESGLVARAIEQDLVQSLLSTLWSAFRAEPGPREEAVIDTPVPDELVRPGAATAWLSFSVGYVQLCLYVAQPLYGSLVAGEMNEAPSSEVALHSMASAIGPNRVTLDVSLDVRGSSVGEVAALAPGDVLMLDRLQNESVRLQRSQSARHINGALVEEGNRLGVRVSPSERE